MGDVDTTADAPLKLSAPAPHPDLLLGQSIEVDLGNLTGYDYQPQDLSAFSYVRASFSKSLLISFHLFIQFIYLFISCICKYFH